jgi:hypothetical protein
MRPIEILFVTFSVLVIVLVGFAPLFPSEPPEQRIKHECRLFYSPSGDAARGVYQSNGRLYNHAKPIALRHNDLSLNAIACVPAGLTPAIQEMILMRMLGT